MDPKDKNYLTLQFRNKILENFGTEFQSFFENLMVKAFSDFQTVRPNGNEGDGGNDGFRKNTGIYYQIYSPNTPAISYKKAVSKLKEDFEKLKEKWGDFSEIRRYLREGQFTPLAPLLPLPQSRNRCFGLWAFTPLIPLCPSPKTENQILIPVKK